jgi:hypothetical protein
MSAPPPPQHRNNTNTQAPTSIAPTAPTPDTAPKEWREEDYINSLAHLESLQETVSALRGTIPQLVRSLTRKHASPADLWADFSREALGSGEKMGELRRRWEGAEMRKIKARVDNVGAGSFAGMGEDVERELRGMGRFGWIEEAAVLEGRKRKRDVEQGKGGQEDVDTVVETFGKRHEGISATLDKASRHITIDYTSNDGTPLHFAILPTPRNDNTTIFDVTGPRIPDTATTGERKLLHAAQRCLAKREKQGSLAQTLENVAAYRDLREVKCDVCQKMLDGGAMLPAGRRSKRSKGEGGDELKWVAVHESCFEDKT